MIDAIVASALINAGVGTVVVPFWDLLLPNTSGEAPHNPRHEKPQRSGDHVHSTRSRLPRHKRLARHRRRHRHDPTRVAQLHATKMRRRHVEAMHACFDAAWERQPTGWWADRTRKHRACDRS